MLGRAGNERKGLFSVEQSAFAPGFFPASPKSDTGYFAVSGIATTKATSATHAAAPKLRKAAE
jgi:hypothetical protein